MGNNLWTYEISWDLGLRWVSDGYPILRYCTLLNSLRGGGVLILRSIVQFSHPVFSNSLLFHYNDVIMGAIASQITILTIVYSTVYSGADRRKHQSSVSLAFVRVIHRWPVNSSHKWPITRKIFPFDDAIMYGVCQNLLSYIIMRGQPIHVVSGGSLRGLWLWTNPVNLWPGAAFTNMD